MSMLPVDEPLRVLVTRPASVANELVDALATCGVFAGSIPLLAINDIASDASMYQQCRQTVLNLDAYQHIIFISTNAVHYGMRWIEDYWPQLPVGIDYYAVGAATERQLLSYGIVVCDNGGNTMSSEGLLTSPLLKNLDLQRILIVRGYGGRPFLGEQLASRGAKVDYLECYQRVCPTMQSGILATSMVDWRINVVIVNSGETLQNYRQLLAERWVNFQNITVVVPSKRVAAIAQDYGLRRVVVAENASTQATLKALFLV